MSILFDVANAVADKLRDEFPNNEVTVTCAPNFDPSEMETPRFVVIPWGLPEITALDRTSSKAHVEVMVGVLHYNGNIKAHVNNDVVLLESAIKKLYDFAFETAESEIQCMPLDIQWNAAYNAEILKNQCVFESFASCIWQCEFTE